MGESPRLPANDLEALVFRWFPRLAEARRSLLRSGAKAAALSGSGSALFGLFADRGKARRAARRLERSGLRVFVTRTASRRKFQAQLPFVQRSRRGTQPT